MIDDNVFEVFDGLSAPPDVSVVGSMFVLTIKRDPITGKIDKYKARLVALGNQQDPSSYEAIKSGTARAASVKLLISLQAKIGGFSTVMDVKGAYLKSAVDPEAKPLFLRLPDKKLVKLKKYLYGLKQAGYEWQQNITRCLIRLGYCQSTTDQLVFTREIDMDKIHMCIHVDDFFVVATNQELIKTLHDELVEQYGEVTIKSGDLLAYLGCKVAINSSGIIDLTQPVYIKSLTEKYLDVELLKSTRRFRTPMKFTETEVVNGDQLIDQGRYLEIVGSLNYLAQFTRPDILYAVSVCAQKCSRPTLLDLARTIRIIQYLKDTPNVGISFHPGKVELTCYADASYNVYSDGRSHYGYTFSLGRNDGSFYAKSKKMSLTALSSTEAEYVALCEATRDAIWLRRLLSDLGYAPQEPTLIWQDNLSTIDYVNGHRTHQASKHINPKFHFTGDQVELGEIVIRHMSTDMMVADILTKSLAGDDHVRLANMLLG